MKTLTLDVETHSRRYLYTMPPEKFVRLCGYAWDNDPVQLTTDLEELREQILKARLIVGHNIHDFDLRGIFGIESNTPMKLADEGRVYDTWTHAALVNPAPSEYINRHGKKALATTPEKMLAWFGLDEQAYQLGVAGKTHDLKELAHEFGDPELSKKDRIEDGFGKIPVDDPRYRAYLIGDVEASRAVGRALLKKGSLDAYAMREQRIESRKAAISSNGWRLDKEAARARSESLRVRREELMAELSAKYDFPQEGDKPWLTNPGKNAIMAVLADHGVRPNADWPKTPSYSKKSEAEAKAKAFRAEAVEFQTWLEIEGPNLKPRSLIARERKLADLKERSTVPTWFGLSLAGDTLISLTKGTAIEELGVALAELMGQRSLSDLALECCYPDGRVHPEITMLQRSGRWSTTKPGLTIWTSRGEGAAEKDYFVPDFDDHVLIEIDLSNADARAVAAMSGDKKYAERFEPGADGHLINAWAAWGKDKVGTDKHNPETAAYRQLAKPGGHGWGYRIGANKLAATWNKPAAEAKRFLDNMNRAFGGVVAWQERATKFASRNGYVVNAWGRKMVVEKGREYTQAPALLGQSVTREIVCDALLAMSYAAVRSVKAQIHDALVFSVPRDGWERYRDYLLGRIETFMDPKGGQRIDFPAECGPPGTTWHSACH